MISVSSVVKKYDRYVHISALRAHWAINKQNCLQIIWEIWSHLTQEERTEPQCESFRVQPTRRTLRLAKAVLLSCQKDQSGPSPK